jgi:ankyrin repeat protein
MAFQANLDRWAISIKEETAIIEIRENSRSRALVNKFSQLAAHQEKIAKNLRVLDFCSKYDYETAWKQTRKVGNTALFSQLTEYQEWKESSSSCTLLCTGKLGSGKSVLLANIVDDLNIDTRNGKTAVTYFFCRHDLPESLKLQTILGSLARQLLQTIPDLARVAETYGEARSTTDTEILLEIISHGFPSDHKAYFILDGLDECGHKERLFVAQELQKVQKMLRLLLCISFRTEPDNGLELITKRFAVTKIATIPEDNPEIEAFIEAELERCLESRNLVIGDPTLILEIQDALLKGSQGMFLWVVLQIQSLCSMRTDQAIRDTLADLPNDLAETFTRILHKSGGLGQFYQTQILQLLVAAYRPLTVGELRDALSVVPGDTDWTPSRMLNDVYSALSCCGCLLTVDEEETTIRFVHHSVKQFLLNDFSDTNNIPFTVERAQRIMADIIITYLSYGVFGTELSRKTVHPVTIQSAPASIVRVATENSSTIQSLALRLLKSRKGPDFDISKTLAEARRSFQSRPVDKFYFYSYAATHWPRHIAYVSGQDKNMHGISVRLINRRILEADAAAKDNWPIWAPAAENGNGDILKLLIEQGIVNTNATNRWGMNPILQAAKSGRRAVVELLLDTGKVNINSKDQYGKTPLLYAAQNGHEAVVDLLLSCFTVEVNEQDSYGQTALSEAIRSGHTLIVKMLVDINEVNVNVKDSNGMTPLFIASWMGREEVVKQLLDTGNVDVEAKGIDGQTSLSSAAQRGHGEIVKLLLDSGKADTNATNKYGQTPLSLAVQNGHEAVVELLLNSGKVDANLQHKDGQTPLSMVAETGHEAIAKLLLKIDQVDVDAKVFPERTPLSIAAQNGRVAIVKLLLDTGKVDVNSKDRYGKTPLWWAAQSGHEGVVKLFLEIDIVDVNVIDSNRRQTPLSLAAENGNDAIVKLLVNTGKVDVNAKDRYGQVPLLWAIQNKHEAVVNLLLELDKVDADAKDLYGQTPLLRAAQSGYETLVKLLLDTGRVDVNTKDYSLGKTPLSFAAEEGHAGVVTQLLNTDKIKVNEKDNDWRRTPLSFAARNGHDIIVKLLVNTPGVEVDVKDRDGRTPLAWAVEWQNEAMIEALLNKGLERPHAMNRRKGAPL